MPYFNGRSSRNTQENKFKKKSQNKKPEENNPYIGICNSLENLGDCLLHLQDPEISSERLEYREVMIPRIREL